MSYTGFYFDKLEEFELKMSEAPYEEVEIDYIDGDSPQLFGAARIDQSNLAVWFENLDYLSDESDEAYAIMYLADLFNLQEAIDRHEEVIIWHGTAEDYAAEIIDETMNIESLPEIIRYNIDYTGIARDMQLNSEIAEISQDIWVVNCFDF